MNSAAMGKPLVFVPYVKDYFQHIHELLKERFDVEYWESNSITKEELMVVVKGKFGILTTSTTHIDADVCQASEGSLRVVSCISAGHENIDVNGLKSVGVKVGSAGSAITEATAEVGIAHALIAARHMISYALSYKNGEIRRWIHGKNRTYQQGLENSVVGIVGSGRIGISMARKVKAFNIGRLLYFSRSEKPEMQEYGGEFKSLEDVMRESDFIMVALAYNKSTEKIISKRMIDLMKPTAVIVNVGRGSLIDQDALLEALQNKRIGAAGLDVTTPEPLPLDHPLFKLDNVFITPHIGFATMECSRQATKLAVDNLIAVLDGKPMPSEL